MFKLIRETTEIEVPSRAKLRAMYSNRLGERHFQAQNWGPIEILSQVQREAT